MRVRLVVLGNGMTSHRLCRRLAEGGATSRYAVHVFGEEPHPAYDRVHMTRTLAGARTEELFLSPAAWYAEQGIQLNLETRIEEIDRERAVVRGRGVEEPWDVLVLATGSRPRLPPLPGLRLPGVFTYRTLEDLAALRERCRPGLRVSVLGGGLLGLEAARAVQLLGAEVEVSEINPGLMSRQLDPEASAELRRRLEALGLRIRTNVRTSAIERDDGALAIIDDEGRRTRADLVVVAAGIEPADELAVGCGLVRAARGGVLVDSRLRSSDPRIHAIGECAAPLGQVHGFVVPGYRMADALADALLGREAEFVPSAVPVRLKLAGTDVAALGDPQSPGDAVVHADGASWRRLVVLDGRLVGASCVGPAPDLERLEAAVSARARVGFLARRRFRLRGRLEEEEADVRSWPDSALVCLCTGTSAGRLRAARSAGCATVETLAKETGASTVCGSCRPHLDRLCGGSGARPPARVQRGLLAASVAAALAAAAIAILGPWEARSVDDSLALLRTESAARQLTGWLAAGFSAIGLALSLRKRWARFSAGSVGAWRAVHGALGVLALAAVAAHTGLRMGSNLNFVLMLDFLALAVAGAAAGAAVAWEERLPAAAGLWLRRALVATHLAAFWVWPVLLGFHVFKAWYF